MGTITIDERFAMAFQHLDKLTADVSEINRRINDAFECIAAMTQTDNDLRDRIHVLESARVTPTVEVRVDDLKFLLTLIPGPNTDQERRLRELVRS